MIDYVIGLGVVVLCTAISIPLRSHLVLSTFAMLYLLGVIVVSMRCRRRAAVLNALLSVTAFYYFCVPVHDSFVLEDSNYLITLVVMLIAALVISTLTFKIRAQATDVINAEIAVQTERMRNSLLSAVSHDIKTPLASIYGAATGLLESGPLNESQRRDLVESIVAESERLNCVVTNLLEMTRLDAGVELKRDWYPLEEILGAALTRVDKPLRGRNVMVNIPSDLPLIRVDEVLIEEVFANILENAAKYTQPGTPIEVAAFESADKVIIIIRDKGPGFPPGDEERVFDKFFRGKNESTRGVGLGLAICRSIIQHHEGIITASNAPNGGAIVTIELPIGGTPPVFNPMSESLLT